MAETDEKPKPQETEPAVSSPEPTSSPRIQPFQLPSVSRRVAEQIVFLTRNAMVDLWLDAAKRIVYQEPEYPQNIWRELGFWRALKLTVWMVCHPYAHARVAARCSKNKLACALNERLETEAWRASTARVDWELGILRTCDHAFAEMQRVLDTHAQLAYEQVMRGIQPPPLYPKAPQPVEQQSVGMTFSEAIDKAKGLF